MKSIFKHITFIFALGLMTTSAICQTYVVPDTNFRNFLQDRYPASFNAQGELMIANAALETNNLTARSENIDSIDGIWFFTGIEDIDIDDNNVRKIPDLSAITGLRYIDFDGNQIDSIPPLTSLSQLEYLKCDDNNLVELPDFTGLTNLDRVFCRRNQLTKLPDFTGCTSLEKIICTYNQIDSLPDFSQLPNFKRLICHNNQIKALPDFDLGTFSSLLAYKNQLSFDDFIKISAHPNFADSIELMPQDTIRIQNEYTVSEGDNFTLQLDFDDTVSTNIYYWFFNDERIDTTTTNELNITNFSEENVGHYHCLVNNSNPLFIGHQIVTEKVLVDLSNSTCLDASQLNYEVIDEDCKNGFSIELDTSSIVSESPILVYNWINALGRDTIKSTFPFINQLLPGTYELKLQNSNCSVFFPGMIHLEKPEECKNVFTPNGDNENDFFLLDASGDVRIFDSNGNLVRSLVAPEYWDGRDDTGQLVPIGVYAIMSGSNEVLNVTVVY